MLPPLSTSCDDADIKRVLKAAFKQLGPEGKKAMSSYLSKCGLPQDSKAMLTLDKVFQQKEADDSAKEPKKKRQRTHE